MSKPILKIDKSKNNEFQFDVSVDGTSATIDNVKLCLKKQAYQLSFPGDYKEGTATVKVSSDYNDILDGVDNFELQVFIKDRFFVPLEGDVQIESPVSVSAGVKQNKVEKISIKANLDDTEKVSVSASKDEKKELTKEALRYLFRCVKVSSFDNLVNFVLDEYGKYASKYSNDTVSKNMYLGVCGRSFEGFLNGEDKVSQNKEKVGLLVKEGIDLITQIIDS